MNLNDLMAQQQAYVSQIEIAAVGPKPGNPELVPSLSAPSFKGE